MSLQITLEEVRQGDTTELRGYVGKNNIIILGKSSDGKWTVDMSTCLPGDLAKAAIHLECMKHTFDHARELGAIL